MPKGEAFAERIAESKAITDEIIEKKLAVLAERNKILAGRSEQDRRRGRRGRAGPRRRSRNWKRTTKPAEEVARAGGEERRDQMTGPGDGT